jgi:hypothetical protein
MTSILGSLQDFADEIKNDYNIDTTFNVKITIVETIELIKNPDQCIALVTNFTNGVKAEPYQCTRTRRFGMFCGLHHNRKNDFVPVQKYLETRKHDYNITLNI